MKNPRLFLALAIMVLGVAYGQAMKDPVDSVPVRVSSRAKVVASLDHPKARIGDPIILHYRLKNVSSGVIGPLFYNGFGDECWLMVTDASGAEHSARTGESGEICGSRPQFRWLPVEASSAPEWKMLTESLT